MTFLRRGFKEKDGSIYDRHSGLNFPCHLHRHILAAAIRAQASVIVTYNLADFPREVLSKYQIEAQHPDEFLAHLLDLDSWSVCRVVREQRMDLQNPPQSANQLLATFEKQRLPILVGHLKDMVGLI